MSTVQRSGNRAFIYIQDLCNLRYPFSLHGEFKHLLLPITADCFPAFERADQTSFFTAVIKADAKLLPAHCISLNISEGDVIAFEPVEGTSTVSAAGFKTCDPAFGRCAYPFSRRSGRIFSLERFLIHLIQDRVALLLFGKLLRICDRLHFFLDELDALV